MKNTLKNTLLVQLKIPLIKTTGKAGL